MVIIELKEFQVEQYQRYNEDNMHDVVSAYLTGKFGEGKFRLVVDYSPTRDPQNLMIMLPEMDQKDAVYEKMSGSIVSELARLLGKFQDT